MTALSIDYSQPRITTRWVIDHTRKCAARCLHCYWLPTDSFYSVDSWETHKAEVMKAVAAGCDSIEVTGGEPMQSPWIVDLVKLCVDNNLSTRIITTLICPEKTLDAVLEAGVDDWLISMHGAKHSTHDAILRVPRARELEVRRLAKIAKRMDYCVNYTIIQQNQTEMLEWAEWLLNSGHRLPKVANWILFNVFGDWMRSPEWIENGKANIADLKVVGPILDEAIDLLEGAGVGVNLRYFPMCAIAERHRKNVCNDLQVPFDAGEWLNGFAQLKTVEDVYQKYALPLSRRNELQTEPCASCGIKSICGGANKLWHQLAVEKFGSTPLTAQPTPENITEPAFWHYRQHNVLGLDPRR